MSLLGLVRSLNGLTISKISSRCISTSFPKLGLMEFFDEKDNWNKNEVRVGRSWKKEEMRIKSNQDLHKLWFVLLKERNMLLTMEEECNRQFVLFPSPERLDKIKESMVNLEEVVRERNRAYHMLETGETGERPGYLAKNRLGMAFFYKTKEHSIPEEENHGYVQKRMLWFNRKEVCKFHSLMREKIWNAKRKARRRDKSHVMTILRRFPNTDIQTLKSEFPDVDVDRLKTYRKTDGHFVP